MTALVRDASRARTTRMRVVMALVAILATIGGAARAQPVPEPTPERTPEPERTPTPVPAPDPTPEQAPAPEPTPERTPSPEPEPQRDSDSGDTRVRQGAEDESLEELLGLELVDTIGDTTAASRTSENVLAAPATITTLDGDAIRASGARTLPDLLRSVPGVQVAEVAPGRFLVSLRSMNGVVGNNVVVTLEGVPINDPLDGGVEWAAIPFNTRDVERIEVVRGPVSAIYGANAYTGVINIVTYRGYGRLPVWGVRGSATVDDRGRAAGQASFRWARRSEHRELSVMGVGGYDDVFAGTAAGNNPALVSFGMLGRGAIDLGGGRLEAQIGFTALRRSSLEHLSLARVEEWHHVATARVQYTTPDLPSVLGAMAIWARALDHRVPNTNASATSGFSYAGTNSLRSNLGVDLPLQLHDTLRITIGGELDVDAVRAPYVVGGSDGLMRMGYGAYAQGQYDPHRKFSLSGAVRVDRPTVDPTPLLSYRAAAVFHTDRLSLRASASSSFRAPTYVERLGRFVDPAQGIIILEGSTLRAPRNQSFEAGFTYSPHVNVRLGGSIYASRLTRLVLEDFFTIPRKTFRSDDRELWLGGIELETELRLLDALRIEASASIIKRFTDVVGDPPTVAVPAQNSNVTASLRLRGSLRGDRLHYGLGASFASRRSFFGAVGVPWVFVRQNFEPIILIDGVFEHVLPTRLPIWAFVRVQGNPLGRTEQAYLPGASRVGTAVTLGIEIRRD